VTFKDGSSTLGSATLAGGTAAFTTSSLAVGSHSITATYGGDSSYGASSSSVLTETVYLSGDANGDGSVTVGDVFYLINSLFAGGPAPIGPGDANGDGSLTVGDVFYLINYLFAGGPAPH
jgi:Bacterial Ig-like domain (group 3)/Dockerin type I domain